MLFDFVLVIIFYEAYRLCYVGPLSTGFASLLQILGAESVM